MTTLELTDDEVRLVLDGLLNRADEFNNYGLHADDLVENKEEALDRAKEFTNAWKTVRDQSEEGKI